MHTLLTENEVLMLPKVYIKDPETSELGRRIVSESILLIDDIGFDSFTFKKLGERIGSNESSIYRYFENKHKLLIYLCSWYWAWKELRVNNQTASIMDAFERLEKAVAVLTEKIDVQILDTYIDVSVLNRILINEFDKTFLTKEVDEENREGYFLVYKRVVNLLVRLIEEVNPSVPFKRSLASTIIEGGLHQHFFKEHFTSITDCSEQVSPTDFYLYLITQILK